MPEKPAAVSIASNRPNSVAPEMQLACAPTDSASVSGTGFSATASEIAKRPPDLRTRKASAKTAGLSGDKLITQFEMDDVNARVGYGQVFDFTEPEFNIIKPCLYGIGARFLEHCRCHIDSDYFSARFNLSRSKKRVEARTRAEIEDSFAGLQ